MESVSESNFKEIALYLARLQYEALVVNCSKEAVEPSFELYLVKLQLVGDRQAHLCNPFLEADKLAGFFGSNSMVFMEMPNWAYKIFLKQYHLDKEVKPNVRRKKKMVRREKPIQQIDQPARVVSSDPIDLLSEIDQPVGVASSEPNEFLSEIDNFEARLKAQADRFELRLEQIFCTTT